MAKSELPTDINTLAEKVINYNENILGAPWKASPEEPYALRNLNPDRSQDTQKIRDTDRHPETLKWMDPGKPASVEELRYFMELNPSAEVDPRIMWAVVNKKNEILGWVQFYPDEHVERFKGIYDLPENALVLEVSYCKNLCTWPKYKHFIRERDNLNGEAYQGVAVNGLKQSIIRISQIEKGMTADGKPARPIFLTAYMDPTNMPSEKVVEKNGFENLGEMPYDEDGFMVNVWIKKLD